MTYQQVICFWKYSYAFPPIRATRFRVSGLAAWSPRNLCFALPPFCPTRFLVSSSAEAKPRLLFAIVAPPFVAHQAFGKAGQLTY